MLENLQMAQPGQSGDGDMEQALNELQDMIRKQQQLRDKTFKQGQDSRRDRMRGKQGEQSMGDLQQDQQALRDRLKKLQQELAKRGMGQKGQKGQQGQGDDAQQGDGEDGPRRRRKRHGRCRRPARRRQCRRCGGFAGTGAGRAAQGRPESADAMQGDGDGQGDGPGNRAGRQQSGANGSDPLGRPLHGREFGDDLTVKIPGENRRAAGAPDSGKNCAAASPIRSARRSNSITSSGC